MTQPKISSDLKQLAADIRDLAQSLLDDPITGKIIRRVGTHVNFTPEEEEVVNDFVSKANFLKVFAQPTYKGPGFLENTIVAIGVARRVAEGEFSSVDDANSIFLIEDNMFPIFEVEPGNWGAVNDLYWNREIDFEDYYKIFSEYMQLPELPGLLREWREKFGTEDGGNDAADAAEIPAIRIMRRYGLVRRSNFMNFANYLIVKKIDYSTPEKVLREIKQYHKVAANIRGIDNG